jgi:TRAP-type C4-dicarboxylate transport system permease small subunit
MEKQTRSNWLKTKINKVSWIADKMERLSELAAYLASAFIIAAAVVIMADILARNVTGRSIDGVVELSSWLMAALSWMALSYTLKEDGHIQVRILIDRLPARVRQVLQVVLYMVGVGFMIFLVDAMWDRLHWFIERGQLGMELKVPIWWLYSVVFTGACLFLLQWVVGLWRALAALITGASPESNPPDGRL